MNATYDRLRETATRLLVKYGATMTLRRTTATSTTTDLPTKGIYVERVRHVAPESQIEVGDWLLVLDSTNTPKVADRLIHGSASRVVMKVEEVRPDGNAIVWYVWARDG